MYLFWGFLLGKKRPKTFESKLLFSRDSFPKLLSHLLTPSHSREVYNILIHFVLECTASDFFHHRAKVYPAPSSVNTLQVTSA